MSYNRYGYRYIRAYPAPEPRKRVWVIPIQQDPRFLTVLLRLRTAVARGPAARRCGMGVGHNKAARHRNMCLQGSGEGSEMTAGFGEDPLKVLRETRFPAEQAEEKFIKYKSC